ncbi:hypothetical protein EJ02DRAFT_461351 [Clathrospora elynae]|uniref:F-box domain-containing protein n=1 Tax=Clathrospora elynae TaxID=706981 RepID=A0A6A5T7K0_9PLEO|nr:hypothetical protein EJ02DRAFT_461351 [Clathrospora elynae]
MENLSQPEHSRKLASTPQLYNHLGRPSQLNRKCHTIWKFLTSTMSANTGGPLGFADIPLPAPEPVFSPFPIELANNTGQYLTDRNDLFALRRTCRFYRSITAPLLAPFIMAKLSHLRVLTTEKGLQTLFGLTSTPEWRSCIASIELVESGLVAPAQRDCYTRQAPALLKEIFGDLKTVEALEEIYIGAKDNSYRHEVGLKHLMRDVGFDHIGSWLLRQQINRHIYRDVPFPQLTTLDLRAYTITNEALISFLGRIEKTIRSIGFRGIQLSLDTWSSVFEALTKLEKLNTLSLGRVLETRRAAIPSNLDDGGYVWSTEATSRRQDHMPRYLSVGKGSCPFACRRRAGWQQSAWYSFSGIPDHLPSYN